MTNEQFAQTMKAEMEKILRVVGDIYSLLLNGPGKHDQKAVSSEDDAQGKDKPSIALLPSGVSRPSNRNVAQSQGNKPLPRWKRAFLGFRRFFTLRNIALVAGIAYAVVTCMEWRDLQHNFVTDERAWLNEGVSFPKPDDITQGNEIKADIILENAGKTPSKIVRYEFGLDIPKSAQGAAFDYSSPHTAGFIALFNPAHPVVITVTKSDPPQRYEQSEADDLIAGKRYMALYGRGQYNDMFGNTHWFKYCFSTGFYKGSTKFASAGCARYNDTGDGELTEWKK